jgi:Cu/Ag efflux pump CusA
MHSVPLGQVAAIRRASGASEISSDCSAFSCKATSANETLAALSRRQKGDSFSLQDLKSAVIDGAMLRLRPKVMTVATVIASLLPIMWSTRTGAEVMKPLATPVIGGMVSSLLHVLVVTPVIFYWLRRRALNL